MGLNFAIRNDDGSTVLAAAIPEVGIGYLGVALASGKAGFVAGGFASNGFGDLSPGGYGLVAALLTKSSRRSGQMTAAVTRELSFDSTAPVQSPVLALVGLIPLFRPGPLRSTRCGVGLRKRAAAQALPSR